MVLVTVLKILVSKKIVYMFVDVSYIKWHVENHFLKMIERKQIVHILADYD